MPATTGCWNGRTPAAGKWVLGNAERALADGFEVVDRWPTGRWRAPYGNYYARDQHSTTDAEPGWWQVPTADFLAGLPRDPERLLQRLKVDTVTGKAHLPSGTVTASTAVHRATVDTIGAMPSSG